MEDLVSQKDKVVNTHQDKIKQLKEHEMQLKQEIEAYKMQMLDQKSKVSQDQIQIMMGSQNTYGKPKSIAIKDRNHFDLGSYSSNNSFAD